MLVQVITEMGQGVALGLAEGREGRVKAPSSSPSLAAPAPSTAGAGAPAGAGAVSAGVSESLSARSSNVPSPLKAAPSPSLLPSPGTPKAPLWSDPPVALVCHERELRERMPFVERACIAAMVQQLMV